MKHKRDQAIYHYITEMMAEKNRQGVTKYTYGYCLSSASEKFYLSPDTIQDIYLAQSQIAEEQKAEAQERQQNLFDSIDK